MIHIIFVIDFSWQGKEPQIKNQNIKNEIPSTETSPISDPLAGLGDKLDHLTAKLLHEKPRKMQNIGDFRGCRDLNDEDVDLLAAVFLEVGGEE